MCADNALNSADPDVELADGQWRSHTQITGPAWPQMAVSATSWPIST